MSFDLEVYGEHSLSSDQIAEVVLSVGGLVAEWDAEGTSVTAVHHADSERHCLTLDGPFDIEEEDNSGGMADAPPGPGGGCSARPTKCPSPSVLSDAPKTST